MLHINFNKIFSKNIYRSLHTRKQGDSTSETHKFGAEEVIVVDNGQ